MATNWRSGRLQVGKVRHKVDIVKVSPIQDGAGGINFSVCKVYANVWASVEALGGEESMGGQSEMSVVSHQVVIRYIGAAPSWSAQFVFPDGALVKDELGYLQQAQNPSNYPTAAVEPSWNEIEGGTTSDGDPSIGTFTWLNLGVAPPYTGVTSAMQVWFQGRQFQVKSVQNPDEKNKLLCLMCVEINDSRNQITNQPGGLG